MSVPIRQNLVSSSRYRYKCPYQMDAKYIVIHNTANDASAESEVKYMISNNNYTSYHFAVDDKEIVQGVPVTRNAYHAGDGNGPGNMSGIGIEICYSKSGGDRYYKAEDNAAWLAAKLLKERGWDTSRLKQHYDFSGKNCPHRIRAENRWPQFVNKVKSYMDTSNSGAKVEGTIIGTNFLVKIKADELNIRVSDSFTSTVVGVVKKGQVYTITETSNGLGKLKSGAGWISMGEAYVEKYSSTVSVSTPNQDTSYQIRVVNCDTLNARRGPSTSYGVAEEVKVGTVLTIVGEQDGWLKTKSGLWINKAYTKKL